MSLFWHQVAVPRKSNPKLVMRTKKIFVGGLSATTSLEDIKAYFEQFSAVKESMLAYDKVSVLNWTLDGMEHQMAVGFYIPNRIFISAHILYSI